MGKLTDAEVLCAINTTTTLSSTIQGGIMMPEVHPTIAPEIREFAPGYFASPTGQIFCTNSQSGRGKCVKPREVKCRVNHRGYACVAISVDGARKCWRVNRAVATAWIGPAPSKNHEAAHLNGNRLDNRPENLEWKTAKGNCADRKLHGTQATPATQVLSLQSATEIIDRAVLQLRGFGIAVVNRSELAAEYGVSPGQITAVVVGRSWTQLHSSRAGKLEQINALRGELLRRKNTEPIRQISRRFKVSEMTIKTLWGRRDTNVGRGNYRKLL